jgi:hypothetical protein
MKSLKDAFFTGAREGWALFWSPLTGAYKAAKEIISPERSVFGAKENFKAGMRDGWRMYWSPITAFCKAAKTLLTSK